MYNNKYEVIILSLMKIDLLNEKDYFNEMENTVKPYLNKYEHSSYLLSDDNNKLFYKYYLIENPKANIVISHGLNEFSEKYNEMMYYFLKRNFNVFIIEHRGHGHSYREVEDTSISHINSYNEYVSDFNCFLNKIVLDKTQNLPLYLYAHSMGGAIATLFLMKYPQIFDNAILTAPMIYPKTANVPSGITKFMTKMFSVLGKGKERVFVHKEFNPNAPFETSNSTSLIRFNYFMNIKRNNKLYFNSSTSYRWVNESLKITKTMLNRKNCQKIKTKVFMIVAESDKTVKKEEQIRFVKMVNNAKFKEIKGSKHEIYMSNNKVLKEYLEEIFLFFEN